MGVRKSSLNFLRLLLTPAWRCAFEARVTGLRDFVGTLGHYVLAAKDAGIGTAPRTLPLEAALEAT